MDVGNVMRGILKDARARGRLALWESLTIRDIERAGFDTWPFWRALWNLPPGASRPPQFIR